MIFKVFFIFSKLMFFLSIIFLNFLCLHYKKGLEFFFKFGYAFLIITLLLMIWMSLARASLYNHRELEEMRYPPCSYNALCTCSKSSSDLGIVYCKNVPFPALPRMVNQSKVIRIKMKLNVNLY